jgi:hypothetical protein
MQQSSGLRIEDNRSGQSIFDATTRIEKLALSPEDSILFRKMKRDHRSVADHCQQSIASH